MSVEIVKVTPEHVPALGKICFEAFGALQDRHGVQKDFETVDVATMVVGMFASRPDVAGFMAVQGGTPIGSNFILMSDAAAAVGPITVSPGTQARGVGRQLMDAVMDEAKRRGISRVRLQQEAINTASMSLYTKLGYDWREGTTLLDTSRMRPTTSPDAVIRPATEKDLPAIDRISTRQYHTSRVNECAVMLKGGFPGAVLERRGSVEGYCFPGFLGHGFAATATDLSALIGAAAASAPPPFQRMIIPLGQHELHRRLLEAGARAIKHFNYMTVGEWKTPTGAWAPSIGC